MKERLQETAYQYFPKGISSIEQPGLYHSSKEFKSLSNVFIENFEKQQRGEFDSFYDKLQDLDKTMHLHKYGLYIPNERAHNLQLADVKGNTLYSICLNISIIAPYYTIYILETDVERFTEKPVDFTVMKPLNTIRNKEMESVYDPLLKKIRELTEEAFQANFFPEELIYTIIPDINHNRIRFGEFTMFNAFFLDKYSARI